MRSTIAVAAMAIGLLLIAPVEAQQIYDKVSALPMVQRACSNSLLNDPEMVAKGQVLGINVNEVCACQSQMTVSVLSIEELQLMQRGRFTQHAQQKFNQAMYLCGLNAVTRHAPG